MRVTLQPTTSADAQLLANLMQLNLHDLSTTESSEIDVLGLFDAPDLSSYWIDPACAALLIQVDGQPVGFTLIQASSRVQAAFVGHVVAAFFVLRRYRRHGVGRAAAMQLFDRFPGTWEVASSTTNVPAHCFWRSVIQAYTNGHYDEGWHHHKGWRGHIQTFVTPSAALSNDTLA